MKDARVLVIGAGGLGAPALLALAARGVRRIGILDPDRVELSNLHRQILYREQDVGSLKAERAAAHLSSRFPGVEVSAEVCAFSPARAALLSGYDLVLDGTDQFETKLAISDACVDHGVAYVFGAVAGIEGQVLPVWPGRSACLRCFFDEAPPAGAAPTCDELGILGPIAGIVAAQQVARAASLWAAMSGESAGSEALDKLWVYDGARGVARDVRIRVAPDCRGCGSRRHLRGVLAEDAVVSSDVVAPVLDLTGYVCPDTYRLTRRTLEALPDAGRVWVVFTSDEAARNVPKSAQAAGHRVLAHVVDGRAHRILFERSEHSTRESAVRAGSSEAPSGAAEPNF